METDTREKAEATVRDGDGYRQSRNLEKTAWGPDVEVLSSRSPRSPLQSHSPHTIYVQGRHPSSCTGTSCGDPQRLSHSAGDGELWKETYVPDGDGQLNLQLLNLYRYSVLSLKIHLDLS